MEKTIRERLSDRADEKYRKFQSGLLPGIDNILGVRLPDLRKLAKEIVKGDWRTYLLDALDDYYEEIMLQGLVIGYAKADIDEILHYVAEFVPKINNWGVCDSFCINLKITQDHRERVWKFLQPYLISDQEFEIRFAVVMVLNFYINQEYIDRALESLNNVKHGDYYANMAVAWAVSVCFVKHPDKTMLYLQKNNWDDFTFNKALQKIRESLCVDKETKVLIGKMKRNSY
jgi:3-methyladenine DNA glycosylase AlkD